MSLYISFFVSLSLKHTRTLSLTDTHLSDRGVRGGDMDSAGDIGRLDRPVPARFNPFGEVVS